MQNADFLIIGASGKVIIVEGEDYPGYHSTGRSAAVFNSNYGPRLMRVMSKASAAFFFDPPEGFSETPLLTPLGVMFVAREDQVAGLNATMEELSELTDDIHSISVAEALEKAPALRQDYVAAASYDDSTKDMDANAIHSGYLRNARANGVEVITRAEVLALERVSNGWKVETSGGDFFAPTVINAAGAWGDVVGELAGVRPVGLVPMRRTAIVIDAPPDANLSAWCAVADAQEQWYFKPDAGQILASPADETPVPPQDIQPDELDIATLVDRLQGATTLEIKRINR